MADAALVGRPTCVGIENERLHRRFLQRHYEIFKARFLVGGPKNLPDQLPLDRPGIGTLEVRREERRVLTAVSEGEQLPSLTDQLALDFVY